MAIQAIVTRREGEKKFYEMCEINNQRKPNLEWGREHYLRDVIAKLDATLYLMESLKKEGQVDNLESGRQ